MNLAPIASRASLIAAAVLLVMSRLPIAEGRPVSYLGGWTVISENRADQTEAMVGYTFQRSIAAGIHLANYRNFEDKKAAFGSPILNVLLARRNEEGRQSNLYVGAGYGVLFHGADSSQSKGAYVAILDADSETRSFYISLRHEAVASRIERYGYSRGRIGFSPYLAAFGGLHTWVLLQGDYDHWRRRGDVTPLLRFFFQNVLWEMGASFQGRMQFNWAVEV